MRHSKIISKFVSISEKVTKPSLIFTPKTAKFWDVLFWENNPPTLVLSCPILANLLTNPKIGRHMCTAPIGDFAHLLFPIFRLGLSSIYVCFYHSNRFLCILYILKN